MRNKLVIPIIVISFLIAETLLVITEKVLFEESAGNSSSGYGMNNTDKLALVLNSLQNQKLVLTWGNNSKSLVNVSEITMKYNRKYYNTESLAVNFDKLNDILISLAPAINENPTDAKLEFSEKEQKVVEFALPQKGKSLNVGKSMSQIASVLAQGRLNAALAIDEIPPEITLDSIEKLGITTLLGKGESDFMGSSASRIHNIKTGAAKFHGTLLKQGEEFSFNSVLGEVDAKSGYKYELVIKNGKLIPEYGGGICQVSTTLFRAAIYAGLPIMERRGHSLPVRYYNPQGFDATVYPGVIDLKFRNNTANNILIQSRIDETKLTFEIYGSNDGRKVELTGPTILEQKSDGSMKTILARKITLPDASVKEEFFRSTYKSPSLFPLEKNPLE